MLLHDLQFAWGMHVRRPAFAMVAIAAAATMACAFPALHAASLDPLRALRRD